MIKMIVAEILIIKGIDIIISVSNVKKIIPMENN